MNFNDRSDYLQGLLNALGGIEYYENDYDSVGVLYYDLGDYYDVQIGDKTYRCLMLNTEINVTSGIEEIIHTDLPEESETDYSKADKTDRRINQTYLIVDKQNQTIQSVVSNVSDQNTKISQLTQTVDDLTAQISDISDITTYGESSYASVDLTDINESEPIMIKVHATTQNISYLYPRDGLYPSDTLYMPSRSVRFTRTYDDSGTTKTENIDYELPDDLLFYNDTVYDEFYLDYESQTCQVTKRCKYNADGTVSALATEVVHTYPYPTIALGEGNYTISLLGYEYGYIYVRLMAKNIYTTQFYTKVETNSLIRQTVNSIDLSVNQKLTNYATTNEMNSAISVKANEITSSVSNTYITKTASATNIKNAKDEAIASANGTTDTKLTNYYTKTQTETKISQSATSITSSVSATYETKSNASTNYTNLNSKITQASNSITAEVTRAKSAESTLSGKIELKIDKDDNNQIISMINASANRISLTAGRLVITSGNFKLDASGNVTCTNGNFTGTVTATNGSIGGFTIANNELSATVGNKRVLIRGITNANDDFLVVRTGTSGNYKYPFYVHGDGFMHAENCDIKGTITATSGSFTGTVNARGTFTVRGSDGLLDCQINNYGVYYYGDNGSYYGMTTASTNNNAYGVSMVSASGGAIGVGGNQGFCDATGGFYCYGIVPISKEEYKTNITQYNQNALELIKNSNLYWYNYKKEENKEKKHIGFIIGKDYKTPNEVISTNGDGIDLYSMTSVLWKAVQELNEKLEKGA
jgi:hypothetical protein